VKKASLSVTVSAIGVILACIGFVLGILALVFVPLKTHPVYRMGMDLAKNDPAVIELLGSPVKAGFLVVGTTRGYLHAGGSANLQSRISGPWAHGTIYIYGTRDEGGPWQIDDMSIGVGGEVVLRYRGSEPEKGFHIR
jgi:hypothetical protein